MPILTERDAKQRIQALVSQVKKELGLNSPPQYSGIGDPIAKHLKIEVTEQGGLFGMACIYPETLPELQLTRQSTIKNG